MLHKNIPYRRRAERRYKKKLKFLYERIPYFPSGAYKVEKDGKTYYRRYYRGKASSYLKRLSSKRNRRHTLESVNQRAYYRRVFDYWWELY